VEYSDECEEQADKYDRAHDEYDFNQYITAHHVGGMDVVGLSHFSHSRY